jgi:hypothetical protein
MIRGRDGQLFSSLEEAVANDQFAESLMAEARPALEKLAQHAKEALRRRCEWRHRRWH